MYYSVHIVRYAIDYRPPLPHTVPMYPFYDFATRTVLAPTMHTLHMGGVSVQVPAPGRILDGPMSLDEAVSTYGGVTGIGRPYGDSSE